MSLTKAEQAILDYVTKQPATANDIGEALKLSIIYTRVCLKSLRQDNLVYISAYERVISGGDALVPISVWSAGNEEDAIKPARKTVDEITEKKRLNRKAAKLRKQQQLEEDSFMQTAKKEGRWMVKEIAPGIRQYKPSKEYRCEHKKPAIEPLRGYRSSLDYS